MNHLDSMSRRTLETQLAEHHKLIWGGLILGITLGFLGLHFLVARPLTRELGYLRQQVQRLESQVQELSGWDGQVWEANSLLSSLKAQRAHLEEARSSLQAIGQLREALHTEARQIARSLSTVQQWTQLQDRLAAMQRNLPSCERIVQDLTSLQDEIMAQQGALSESAAAVEELRRLQDQIKQTQAETSSSMAAIQQMRLMAEQIQHTAQLLPALMATICGWQGVAEQSFALASQLEIMQATIGQWQELQQSLIAQHETFPEAQRHAQQLLQLEDTLLASDLDTQHALSQLNGLIKLHHRLIGQVGQLADSIEALEILTGFQQEFTQQIQLLGQMRRSLIELGMLESTVTRAVRMLEPLLQLGNVSKMTEAELRQAAQRILEQRSLRISQQENGHGMSAADQPFEPTVPMPIEE
ncbi:MAG: hypothetical protein KatS3mg113_0560 [Planctomycetaceae bacterium]|nr:MAG: hypothetical protein KatS3mg113_0560 [Planctomycetaceae bacterium]